MSGRSARMHPVLPTGRGGPDILECGEGGHAEHTAVPAENVRATGTEALVARGEIAPLLAGTRPLSQIHRAQADFVAKGFVGELVVMPDRFYSSPGAPRDGPR